MSHPQDLSLREQAAAIAAGDLDAAELIDATLARIEERNGPLNAVIATFADEAHRMLAAAPRGPLHGVPVAVKDQFALPWYGPKDGTSREQLAPGESGMYRLLRDAGAVLPAVTHMAFWGGDSTGVSAAYGPVGNPWNPKHVAGGSSGGSAASVAARMVAGSVGADGGGSIRLPAAYCGITGIKPTFGRIPTDGNIHGYLTLDSGGPFGRDAGDARLMLEALTGLDLSAGDASSLRVGLVRTPFWEDLDPVVESACTDVLGQSGWSLEDVELEGSVHSRIATVLHVALEGLPSLDLERELPDANPVTRALVKFELTLPASAYVRAQRVRTLLRREVKRIFESGVDLLAWPTVPAPAPPIEAPVVQLPSGVVPADAANVRQAGLGNLTGIPGINAPVGLHTSGLPMGLMLMAPWGNVKLLLDAAEHIENVTSRQHVDAEPALAATS
jgi:Asp-tRNA(Asn)/Glu-tRNA(Gln) amidotransferase A subunit family amidase